MKHRIIYVLHALMLGNTFCLSLPQQPSQSNQQNVLRTRETTTAVPLHITQTMTIDNSLLTTSSIATTQKAAPIDTTTSISHVDISTERIFHYSSSIETSTQNLRSSSIHTTTAMPKISIITSSERQFDILSFLGGSVFTFCLMAIGVVLWKAYKIQIERNYRTI